MFEVPAGTARIDVETSFTDGDRGTALEFGLYDPVRFRGASRFSKTRFFISRTVATPSYISRGTAAGSMAPADRRPQHQGRRDLALSSAHPFDA